MNEDKTNPNQSGPDQFFGALVGGLWMSTMTCLGKPVVPSDEKPEVDLGLARHTISTLEMLQTKTAGNLTADESKGLEDMLYQLRMAYIKVEVEQAKKAPTEPKPEVDPTAAPKPSEPETDDKPAPESKE